MQTVLDISLPATPAIAPEYAITAFLAADADRLLALFDLRASNDDEPPRVGRLGQGS